MSRRERIIELAREIDATRGKLRAMEAEIDSLLPSEQPAAVAVATTVTATAEVSLTDRVIGFLLDNRPRSFSAAELAAALHLPADRMNSLRSTLVRLVDEQRIARPEPGRYSTRLVTQHAAA